MNINAINQYRVNKYNDLKNKSTEQTIDPSTSSEINFKGGKNSKVSKFFAEYYGKAMLNSDGVRNFCKKLSKGNASNHFQVVHKLQVALFLTSKHCKYFLMKLSLLQL